MWIKMNYTNFTTDKPAVYEQSSASTFGSVRDIAYLIFSILQFGITVFTLVLVHIIIRNKDKKDKKELLEKEERDKTADIIDNEYKKIVEDGIDENLRKCKAKFEDMVMFYGSEGKTRGRIKNNATWFDFIRNKFHNPTETVGIDENHMLIVEPHEETGGRIEESHELEVMVQESEDETGGRIEENHELKAMVLWSEEETADGIDENHELEVIVQGSEEETGGRIEERNKETSAKQDNYKITTGLDVLRFMLRNPNDYEGEPLKKLQKDLDAVVRLFRTLRIKLPLKGDCPINIKEELGPLITDVGEIARSFVSGRKRHTIASVLKYFGNDRKGVKSIETEKKEDDGDNGEIRRICPYINGLSLGENKDESGDELSTYNDQDFSFDIFTIPGNQEKDNLIAGLAFFREYKLCNKRNTIRPAILRSLADKIDVIWRRKFPELPMPDWSEEEHLCANILHVVHVFLFKVVDGSDIIQDEELNYLLREMRDTITDGLIADDIKLCGLSYFCPGVVN